MRLEFKNVQKTIIQVKMKMLEEEDSACVDKILEFNFIGNRGAAQGFLEIWFQPALLDSSGSKLHIGFHRGPERGTVLGLIDFPLPFLHNRLSDFNFKNIV